MSEMSPLVFAFFVASVLPAARAAEWSDWDKRQTCSPDAYQQPVSVADVVAAVSSARTSGSQVKVVGAGHSFSACTLTDAGRRSIMLNLDRLDSVLSWPSANSTTVRVEAGIRVHALNALLLGRGWALPNVGAIAQQSVAGATQTGTHGTGRNLGSMSTQIRAMKLVLANGSIVETSPTQRPELFAAARVGVGALGVVVEVELAVVPKFKLRRVLIPYDLDDLLKDLPQLNEKYERLQWYYTPYTKNASLLLRVPVPIDTPITGCWPGDLSALAAEQNQSECVDWSFKALCHEADDATLYTEMEYFVDAKHAPALVADFRAFQESVRGEANCTADTQCSLFTGLRYAKSDDIWLSPMYNRDIAVLSMIVLGTATQSGPQRVVRLFDRGLEAIAAKYGGRPHWGKLNFATHADLKPVYPKFDAFRELRERMDPQGMFLNDYLRRVLGV